MDNIFRQHFYFNVHLCYYKLLKTKTLVRYTTLQDKWDWTAQQNCSQNTFLHKMHENTSTNIMKH
jgi:hypothetical protein